MTSYDIGVAMFVGVVLLLALRVPVALAMLLAGGIGYAGITGPEPLLNTLKTLTFSRFSSYTLSIIPLFLLMGEFATKGGLNRSPEKDVRMVHKVLVEGVITADEHRQGLLAPATAPAGLLPCAGDASRIAGDVGGIQ